MSDTTIKVDSAVRDRLALIAADRGSTIRDLVSELATTTPTAKELAARGEAAARYIREHLSPDLNDADLAAGKEFWADLRVQGHEPDSSSQ